jgi:hypothetical protein
LSVALAFAFSFRFAVAVAERSAGMAREKPPNYTCRVTVRKKA